jgi:hypothetical protein
LKRRKEMRLEKEAEVNFRILEAKAQEADLALRVARAKAQQELVHAGLSIEEAERIVYNDASSSSLSGSDPPPYSLI